MKIIIVPDRGEPTESKWRVMTDLETIWNSKDGSYREEFLDQDLPVERSLEILWPDNALEMELRDKKDGKRWRHLLDDEEDSKCDSGTEITSVILLIEHPNKFIHWIHEKFNSLNHIGDLLDWLSTGHSSIIRCPH